MMEWSPTGSANGASMRLDGAAFPIVRMHYNEAGDGGGLALFEQLLAREQPFVVVALGADPDHMQSGEERWQLSRWMKRHREPLHRLVKAMVYVEPQPALRFIAEAAAPVFDTVWGYPLLVAGSETEALPTAERLLAEDPPRSETQPDGRPTMPMNNLEILVSGASVAGLSAAYWLSHYGFKVTVVERAPQLRPGGQALDVRGAAAIEVAERMGILATIRARSTKLVGMSMVDATGMETFRSEERSLTGGRFDSPNVEILRDHLVDVLYDAVRERADFIFNDSIASLRQDDAGVDVSFVEAPLRRFDLVIGADGVRSNVRRLAFGPDEKFIRYLGSYIAVFSVPNFLGLDHWQVFCQDGEIGGGLLVMAKEDPARTYLGFNAAEPLDYDYRDIAAQKQLLTDRIAGAAGSSRSC
jgi:hypothetical protein